MTGRKNDLRALTLDELTGVIRECPWFGAARKELCARMSRIAGNDWGTRQYADAAMYVPSREIIADMVFSAGSGTSGERDAKAVIKEYIAPAAPAAETPAGTSYRRTVTPVDGDFFTKEEYARVTRDSDRVFSRFKAVRTENEEEGKWNDPELGFCTETLGRIYAEQGYFAEAEKIYSRLMLRYPEKSAYFASLIRNLDSDN